MGQAELRDRLQRLGVLRGPGALRPAARRQRQVIEGLLPGEIVLTPKGSCFLHREVHEASHLHGRLALVDLLSHDLRTPAWLAHDERLRGVDLHRLAFVDTETTGLAGGTGTYAFLVGVGLFEEERFIVHQFFMRDYDEEAAQLYALGQLIEQVEGVVSFNGKSFDLPLLETRFIMARQFAPLADLPHLDLLPVARRLWKYRLDSCALSSLETEVLGVQRAQADVPGWLIPTLYAEYTRSGDAREMPRIFYHNTQDILSMVTLTAHLCNLVSASVPRREVVPGEDLYGLGRLFHERGWLDRAEAAYAQSAETCRAASVRGMAMRDLGLLLKRQERRQEALAWWQRLAETEAAPDACEELAKHYEWQDEDLSRALAWTERGLELARSWAPSPNRETLLVGFEHRRARLEAKLKR